MNQGQDDRKIRERVRRLIVLQRQLNEQIYRFSQEIEDREVQRILSEVVNRGNENIQGLAKILTIGCST